MFRDENLNSGLTLRGEGEEQWFNARPDCVKLALTQWFEGVLVASAAAVLGKFKSGCIGQAGQTRQAACNDGR